MSKTTRKNNSKCHFSYMYGTSTPSTVLLHIINTSSTGSYHSHSQATFHEQLSNPIELGFQEWEKRERMIVSIDSLHLSSSSSSLSSLAATTTMVESPTASSSPLQQFVWNVLMNEHEIRDPSNVTFVDDTAKCPTMRFVDRALDNLSRHPESLHNLSMDNLYSSWNYDGDDSDTDEGSFYTERLEDDDIILTAVTSAPRLPPPPSIEDTRWGESPTYMQYRKKIGCGGAGAGAAATVATAPRVDMGLVTPKRRISSDDSYDHLSFVPSPEEEQEYEEDLKKHTARPQQKSMSTSTRSLFQDFDADYFGTGGGGSRSNNNNSSSEAAATNTSERTTSTSTRATVSVNRIITQAIDLANSPPKSRLL